MPIIGGAIIGGAAIGGGLISSKGSKGAARAQLEVAEKQLGFAREESAQSRADRERAFQIATQSAIPSMREIQQIDKLISRSEQQLTSSLKEISRGLEVINSVEPAVKESGDQLYRQLKGELTPMLAPVQEQRQRDRARLEQQLADRLGSGFRGTSAGVMALNRFDDDTASIVSQAQMQSINQLTGISMNLGSLMGQQSLGMAGATTAAFQAADQTTSAALNAEQNIASRRMQAVNPLVSMGIDSRPTMQAFQSMSSAVGNLFAGQVSMGQNIADLGSNLGQALITRDALKGLKANETTVAAATGGI
jgi:hypothetical protein